MSKNKITSVQCPNCRRSSKVTIWESINVDLDPEMRVRVLNDSVFTFVCSSCGFRQGMAYPCLYHNQKLKFMVWWMEANDVMRKNDFAQINNSPIKMPGYRLRVVSTLNRLKEKILIFDHQMDDRAIELLKRYVWSAYLEDKGFSEDRVYFSGANLESEYPEIELVAIDSSGESKSFTISGKNGYPRALEMLHSEFNVPKQEAQRWKVVDHTYWNLAESGRG